MTDMIIHTEVELNATAAEAWSLLGEGFGDWDAWAPGIESSTLEGPLAEGVTRVNETPSLGTVRQELVLFDRERRALAYEMRSNLPPFFSRVRNDWTIEEVEPGRSRLLGEALFALKDEAAPMRDKLEGKMSVVLEVFAVALRDQVQQA